MAELMGVTLNIIAWADACTAVHDRQDRSVWVASVDHVGHKNSTKGFGAHRITARHSHPYTDLVTWGMLASLLPLWCFCVRLLCIQPQVHDGGVFVCGITIPVIHLQKRHSQLKLGGLVSPPIREQGVRDTQSVSELGHAKLFCGGCEQARIMCRNFHILSAVLFQIVVMRQSRYPSTSLCGGSPNLGQDVSGRNRPIDHRGLKAHMQRCAGSRVYIARTTLFPTLDPSMRGSNPAQFAAPLILTVYAIECQNCKPNACK